MSKLFFLALSVLLMSAPAYAEGSDRHTTTMSSGRSASAGEREAWFRQCVNDILEGRADASPKRH